MGAGRSGDGVGVIPPTPSPLRRRAAGGRLLLLPSAEGRRCRRRMRGPPRQAANGSSDHFGNHPRVTAKEFVRYPQDVDPAVFQITRSVGIIVGHLRLVVLPSIHFDTQFQLAAVEIEDVAPRGNLPLELETLEAAIAQP